MWKRVRERFLCRNTRMPMDAYRVFMPFLILIACAPNAAAAIQPYFHLDSCSWDATHIVVVSEGDKIDGNVEVLESWKGELKKGDRISIRELAAFAPEKEREISNRVFERDKKKVLPASVTCSRMVLFLIRKQEKPVADKPAETKWLPAGGEWGGIKVSTAWIEKDMVFAFAQEINPGPSLLFDWGMNECELKCRVEELVAAQNALAEAMRQDDPSKRAAAIRPLLLSDSPIVRGSVIRALGESGAKSLPALRAILKDNAQRDYHANTIHALAKAGGAEVGPELTELLKQELAFWKKTAPGLPNGWWNGDGVKREELRSHYSLAHATIISLGEIHHAGGRDALIEFRDYWKSLPQLDFDQLHKACDAALEKLRRP